MKKALLLVAASTLFTLTGCTETNLEEAKACLADAEQAISDYNLTKADSILSEFGKLFPKSSQQERCDSLREVLDQEYKVIEERRSIYAREGFKAIEEQTEFPVDGNTISISNISEGKIFAGIYDTGNSVAITMNMYVLSEDSEPNIPEVAVYSIDGNQMTRKKTLMTDANNSYSAKSFEVGNFFSKEVVEAPYAIVVKRENNLVRQKPIEFEYHSIITYSGRSHFAKTLTPEDFADGQYILVHIAHLD